MSFNVLIVDDSSSMRAIIKKTIKVSGFDVGEFLAAADGKEALRILTEKWVDVVLTDINMPKMSGIELITEMKQDELMRSIPVVMVTTEGSKKMMQEAMDLGARGYVKKPFLPEDIRGTLSSIMGEGDEYKHYDGDDEDGDF